MGQIINNSATHCPILLKFGSATASKDYKRERLAGRVESSGNAALIATISS